MSLSNFGALLLLIIALLDQSLPVLTNRSPIISTHSFKDIPSFFQILKGIALTILVLWTIAANTLVFVVLYKNPNLQTTPNLLVISLFLNFICFKIYFKYKNSISILFKLYKNSSNYNSFFDFWFFLKTILLCRNCRL